VRLCPRPIWTDRHGHPPKGVSVCPRGRPTLLRAAEIMGAWLIRQRVRDPVSTRKINNVSRFHGGVSPSVGLLSSNNKSTRYAANLQTAKTPDSVIARRRGHHARVLKPIVRDSRLMTGRLSRRGRANIRKLKTCSAYKADSLANS